MSDETFTAGADDSHLLPPGEYTALIESVAKHKEDCLRWTFLIRPYPGGENRLQFFTSLKPNALWKLKETLKAMALPSKSPIQFNRSDVEGKWVRIKVDHEEYKDEMQEKVDAVLCLTAPPDDSQFKDPFAEC